MLFRYLTVLGLTLATMTGAQTPVQGRPQGAGDAAPAQGQPADAPPPVTFKLEINYVEVSARVLDDAGNFVSNLKQSDFTILEDNKPQAINAFGLVRIPFERPEKPLFMPEPVDSDVVSNTRASEGRLYVLALDDLHTDPLRSQRVKIAARKFIEENLGANDLAAVSIIGTSDAAQEPTANRRLLLSAVDKFMGQQPRSDTLEKIEAYNRQVGQMIDPGGDVQDPYIRERLANTRRTFRSLTKLVEWMSDVHGRRKALIYLGEGFGYDLRDVLRDLNDTGQIVHPNMMEIFDNTREVISAATRSDVNIYAVDPRGLGAGADEMIEAGSGADAGMANNVSDPGFSSGGTNFRPDLGVMSITHQLEAAHDNLRMLSEETGGFATVNSNDFTTAFSRIVDENSSYYILGYYSNNQKRDGKYRRIDVKVANRPGVVVRARKGYLAPRGKAQPVKVGTDGAADASAQMRDLLRSPVPVGGISLHATAAVFRGAAPNNTVVVTLEAAARDLKLVEKDGKFAGNLAVAVAIVDGEGKLRGSANPTLELGLRPETYQKIAESGHVRVVSQFALPPGRYQLRAAALSSGVKVGGGVQYEIEVPDFRKAPVALSTVALMSAVGSLSPTAVSSRVSENLPEPTAIREFSSDDELALYVEAYDNQPEPQHKVYFSATVQATDGRVVVKNEQERTNQELAAPGGFGVRMPLKSLSPGLYVLTVELRSGLGKQEPISRLIQFRVR